MSNLSLIAPVCAEEAATEAAALVQRLGIHLAAMAEHKPSTRPAAESGTHTYQAKPGSVDLAAVAAEPKRDRHEATLQNRRSGSIDDVQVEGKLGAVEVFQCDRDSCGHGEGQKVSITVSAEPNVQLERGTSKAREQHIKMEKGLILDLSLHFGSINEGSHNSPSVAGSDAVTSDAYKSTVGDATDVRSPLGASVAPSGGDAR